MRLSQTPLLLIAVMTLVVVMVAGVSIWLLYGVAFDQQRDRLIEVAQGRARMIEAVAEFDAIHSQQDHPLGAAAATLSQIIQAHSRFRGFGETGEFVMGEIRGDQIVFLLSHRHLDMDTPKPVPLDSDLAEPMRQALKGQSGIMIAKDYRAETVLAAYEPVKGTGWGVVAKIDLAEVRQPFVRAAIAAALGALVLATLGAALFIRIVEPLVRRLRESQQYNRMLFEQSPIGLALCRMDGQLVDVNPAFATIIGRTVEEAKGFTYWDITPAGYDPQEEALLQRLKETGRYGPYEKEYVHKDGHWVPVQLKGQLVVQDGESYIWSSVEDISERIRNQEGLRQAATVFDNASEAIVVTNADNHIIRVNRSYTLITGYSAEEALGKNPGFHKSGRHDAAFYQEMWESLNSKGRWQGEMWNRRRDGEIYPAWQSISVVKDEHGRLTNYVSLFSDISHIKATEARLEYMAHHDPLTGLPNRLRFFANLEQALQHARRQQLKVGLLYLDLDRFKPINDSMGHGAGDQLLKVVAERLTGCVRAEDTVARMGGDEFVILLAEVAHAENAGLIAQKVVKAVHEPLTLEGQSIQTSTSVGISVYPDDATSSEELVRTADAAMYHAKQRGRGNIQFYAAALKADKAVGNPE